MPANALSTSTATAMQRVEQHLAFSPDQIAQAKAKLIELMDAKVTVRSPFRTEDGKVAYVEVPNTPIQLAAAVKVIEYGLGKPTQMVLVDQRAGSRPAKADLGKMLLQNPALIETVLRTMKEAAEAAQAIPVQGVTSDPSKAGQESAS